MRKIGMQIPSVCDELNNCLVRPPFLLAIKAFFSVFMDGHCLKALKCRKVSEINFPSHIYENKDCNNQYVHTI